MSLFNLPRAHRAGQIAAKRAANARPATDTRHGEDGMVPEAIIAKVRAQSRFDQLAGVTADRARWFVAFLILGGIALFSALGWYVADARFADNVRVAWVKLDPSGAYTVQFADDVRPVEFFQTTLESKLSEVVEKRYRKNAATITADYRFVGFFLSPKLAAQFLSVDDYNAARVAAELTECKGRCLERDVKVRVVQHRTQAPLRIPDHANSTLYETLVFTTFTERKPDGTVADRRNAIVQMAWRIKGKDEIVSNKAALTANPLGIEILSLDLKEDPTPVPRDDKSAQGG
ncbi:MAG TPA: VirB8/TrbF family protein [Albitalea sp.]|nr:VirB8/TrbF family protein [Albitalea sp.]